MTIESSSLGGGGLEIGDITNTMLTKNKAGLRYLSLPSQPRAMTAAEQAEYPLLFAALPTGAVIDDNVLSAGDKNTFNTSMTITDCPKIPVTSDGGKLLVLNASGQSISEYDSSVRPVSFTLEANNASSDQVFDMSMSADGQVRAYVMYDASVTKDVVFVSTDNGGSYTQVKSSSATSPSPATYKRGSVYVSRDGSMVAFTIENSENVSYAYGRIDNPIASLTLDADVVLDNAKLNSEFATFPAGHRSSFSEDGISFVISIVADGGSNIQSNALYTEDSAATFTTVDLDSIVAPTLSDTGKDEPSLFTVLVDALNFSKWIVISRPTGGIYTVSYTVDKGVTFNRLDTMSLSGLNNATGNAATPTLTPNHSQNTINLHNGYWFWTVQSKLIAIRINDDGTLETYGFIYAAPDNTPSWFWVDFSTDGLSFGVGALTSSNERVGTGTGSITKYLPAALGVNSKILADAV